MSSHRRQPIHRPELDQRILRLLNEKGWDETLNELREEIANTADIHEKYDLRLFASWMAAERGQFTEAISLVEEAAVEQSVEAEAWSLILRAYVEMRKGQYGAADSLLNQVHMMSDHVILQAIGYHVRASNCHHAGNTEWAVQYLNKAFQLVGRDHFLSARILDTYGLTYAGSDNFHAAELFFKESLKLKEEKNDQIGMAVSHGNLGRLYLDWGLLDKAEESFREDLAISRRRNDALGVALMHNHLGQVAIVKARVARDHGDAAEAAEQFSLAAEFLDMSIKENLKNDWSKQEGFARKDRALAHFWNEEYAEADEQLALAAKCFQPEGKESHEEGLAHVLRVAGMIRMKQGRFEETYRALNTAIQHFEGRLTHSREPAEVARTQWEIAHARRLESGGKTNPDVIDEYMAALLSAEESRRPLLVEGIEKELRQVSPQKYYEHVFRRVRGRGMPIETFSLTRPAKRDIHLTVLFLDLKGSTEYGLKTDPETILTTLNQMMADMAKILRKQDAVISGFRGDGFMAMFWDAGHAYRAVEAAVSIREQMDAFNAPRRILKLPPFAIRIGISTGPAVLGNMGTYDMMDYTAIGETVNMGARLEAAAIDDASIAPDDEPRSSYPCISPTTHKHVNEHFIYSKNSPRTVELKGFGPHQVWDVIGRKPN